MFLSLSVTHTHTLVIEQKLQLLPCAIFFVENVSTTKDDPGRITAKNTST